MCVMKFTCNSLLLAINIDFHGYVQIFVFQKTAGSMKSFFFKEEILFFIIFKKLLTELIELLHVYLILSENLTNR